MTSVTVASEPAAAKAVLILFLFVGVGSRYGDAGSPEATRCGEVEPPGWLLEPADCRPVPAVMAACAVSSDGAEEARSHIDSMCVTALCTAIMRRTFH